MASESPIVDRLTGRGDVVLRSYLATILRTAKNPGSHGATLEKIAQLAEEALGENPKDLRPVLQACLVHSFNNFTLAHQVNGTNVTVLLQAAQNVNVQLLQEPNGFAVKLETVPETLPPPEPYQETRIPPVHLRCHVCGGAHDGFAPGGCPNDHGPDSFGGSDYP